MSEMFRDSLRLSRRFVSPSGVPTRLRSASRHSFLGDIFFVLLFLQSLLVVLLVFLEFIIIVSAVLPGPVSPGVDKRRHWADGGRDWGGGKRADEGVSLRGRGGRGCRTEGGIRWAVLLAIRDLRIRGNKGRRRRKATNEAKCSTFCLFISTCFPKFENVSI